MKFNFTVLLFFFLGATTITNAQGNTPESAKKMGFRLDLEAPEYKNSMAYFSLYYDDGNYTIDSIRLSDTGAGVFMATKAIEQGQYVIHIEPDERIDLLLGEKQDSIFIKVDSKGGNTILGSSDTEVFWKFLSAQGVKDANDTRLEDKLYEVGVSEAEKVSILKEKELAQKDYDNYVNSLIINRQNEWIGIYIKGQQPVDPPYADPSDAEEFKANKAYLKDHYFDNMNLSDPRFLRTSYFSSHIDGYLELFKDDIFELPNIASALVARAIGNEKTTDQLLSRLIERYRYNPIMGSENIWSRLYEDYIMGSSARWMEKGQLNTMREDYKKIRYNRIGMDARNILLEDMNGTRVNTNRIEAKALILFFYDSSCGSCVKSIEYLRDVLYPKYAPKGMRIVAINTDVNLTKTNWTNYVTNHGMDNWSNWQNCADVKSLSDYQLSYDLSTMPTIVILDQNKKIIAKDIDMNDIDVILSRQLF